MLKTGLYFFFVSSLGVLYRTADLAYSSLPTLKWFCLFGLWTALICFMTTYLSSELLHLRKTFTRQPHMIKSSAWKFLFQE
jgi:hypothetical protein